MRSMPAMRQKSRLALLLTIVAALVLPSSWGFQCGLGPGSLASVCRKDTSSRLSFLQNIKDDGAFASERQQRRTRLPPLAAIAFSEEDVDTSTSPISVSDDDVVKEVIPKTLSEAIYIFLAGPYAGPRIILVILSVVIAYRCTLPLTILDPILFVAAIVYWWFQEHAIHRHILHSSFDWYGKRVHEKHHRKNYFHISLDPAWLMVLWLTTVGVVLKCVLPLPYALTTTIGYAAAGLFYEWSHYIVHTKVRFQKGSYWQRMKDHHIRHHLVNADNWLGFSLPQVDDLFGTNPDVKEFRKQESGR